ncbi:hypothetical protein WICPIJ_001781, partial [Wickerhamomyces pijperi]
MPTYYSESNAFISNYISTAGGGCRYIVLSNYNESDDFKYCDTLSEQSSLRVKRAIEDEEEYEELLDDKKALVTQRFKRQRLLSSPQSEVAPELVKDDSQVSAPNDAVATIPDTEKRAGLDGKDNTAKSSTKRRKRMKRPMAPSVYLDRGDTKWCGSFSLSDSDSSEGEEDDGRARVNPFLTILRGSESPRGSLAGYIEGKDDFAVVSSEEDSDWTDEMEFSPSIDRKRRFNMDIHVGLVQVYYPFEGGRFSGTQTPSLFLLTALEQHTNSNLSHCLDDLDIMTQQSGILTSFVSDEIDQNSILHAASDAYPDDCSINFLNPYHTAKSPLFDQLFLLGVPRYLLSYLNSFESEKMTRVPSNISFIISQAHGIAIDKSPTCLSKQQCLKQSLPHEIDFQELALHLFYYVTSSFKSSGGAKIDELWGNEDVIMEDLLLLLSWGYLSWEHCGKRLDTDLMKKCLEERICELFYNMGFKEIADVMYQSVKHYEHVIFQLPSE